MDREMLLKIMSALPDDAILKALATSGIKIGEPSDALAGMDPGNQVKGWSGISLTKGADDRPDMKAKDYLIEKLALNEGQDMPGAGSDGVGDNYTRPF